MGWFHKKNSIVVSTYIEGLFYALMVGSAESFALFISLKKNFSPIEIGLISTLPLLIGALIQWLAPTFFPKKQIKYAVLIFQFIQMVGIFGLYVFSSHPTYSPSTTFFGLFLSLSLYWIGGMTSSPFWLDWILKWIPAEDFQSYFGLRTSFINLSTLVFYLLFSFILMVIPENKHYLIFFVGLLGRFLSFSLQFMMTRHYDDSLLINVKPDHVKNIEHRQHHLFFFVIFWTGLFKGVVYTSTPFFLPYMIKDLNFTVLDYGLLTGTSLFSRALFCLFWSRFSHKNTPLWLLPLTGVFISMIPFLWTLSTSFFVLCFFEWISGAFWSGFDLACILFIQNFALTEKRQYFGKHMAVMNVFSVFGAFIGGRLMEKSWIYKEIFIFSSACRFLVVIFFVFFVFVSTNKKMA